MCNLIKDRCAIFSQFGLALLATFILLFQSISFAQTPNSFKLLSSAFNQGDKIPGEYTCDGIDISPPLFWENAPKGTGYFTLVVNDPDAPAGNWVHWNVTYIPGNINKLDSNVPTKPKLVNGIKQGKNSWGTVGYRGPCPPGGTHRYFFILTAFDQSGRELGKATLMGKYR